VAWTSCPSVAGLSRPCRIVLFPHGQDARDTLGPEAQATTPYGQRTVYSKGYLPADIDDDGGVTWDDDDVMGENWGMPSGATLDDGDVDGDGDVDSTDSDYWTIVRYSYSAFNYRAYSNDPLTMYPQLGSYVSPSSTNPLPLCDIGHQGLHLDREFGDKYDVRTRPYGPVLARFIVRDMYNQNIPGGGYQDGMSLYEYVKSSPNLVLDPSGKAVVIMAGAGEGIKKMEPIQEAVLQALANALAPYDLNKPSVFTRRQRKWRGGLVLDYDSYVQKKFVSLHGKNFLKLE
jgi:RHS repeat-associated protein